MSIRSMFMVLTIMGILMIMSSHTWFMSWIGLEIMTFFFLPFLNTGDSSFSNKISMWKYFIIQSLGSGLFFFSVQLISMCCSIFSNSNFNIMIYLLIMVSMMMKLGMPPFHSWALEVSENLSWLKFFMINTIQKFGPLVIIWNLSPMLSGYIQIMLMITVMISMMSLFEFSLRRFLVFSSILNVIWMMYSSLTDISSFIEFYLVYLTIMISIMTIFNSSSISNMSNMVSFCLSSSMLCRSMIIMTMFSLCGMPPMMGFFVKFDIIMSLIESNNVLTSIPVLVCSIVMICMYMNIMFSNLMVRKSSFNFMTMDRGFSLISCFVIIVQPIFVVLYFL